MVSNKEKDLKQILAASLYKPSIHGNSFRHSVANDIINNSIYNVSITEDTSYADAKIQANVDKSLSISDNRCMNLFDSKMGKLQEASESQIRFEVNQTYKDENEKEITKTYWYNVKYI
jgi:hypothetical protein